MQIDTILSSIYYQYIKKIAANEINIFIRLRLEIEEILNKRFSVSMSLTVSGDLSAFTAFICHSLPGSNCKDIITIVTSTPLSPLPL